MTNEVALSQVGIIICLEASRVARNNAEWYRLLDLCAVTDTLIGDNDGVYQKVSAPVTVRVNKKSLLERILGLTPYILGGLIAAIAITVAILFFMKKRKPSAPVTVFPPTS